VRRVLLIAVLAATATTTVFAPPPPKKPSQGGKPKADYSDWNCKWFVTCQGESFVVDVKVSNPKTTGGHTFDAHFLPGGGKCEIGADGPQFRKTFLTGVMSNGSLSGTIYLCTTSQELVDKINWERSSPGISTPAMRKDGFREEAVLSMQPSKVSTTNPTTPTPRIARRARRLGPTTGTNRATKIQALKCIGSSPE